MTSAPPIDRLNCPLELAFIAELTKNQRQFVTNKSAGVPNLEAAEAAGYSVRSADVTAGKLMMRPDIQAAIKAAASEGITTNNDPMPHKHYADPMHFLEDGMNQAKMPLAMRVDTARQLLPYKHARMGEVGKKASAKERAHFAIAAKSRFSPQSAPIMLRAIDGGKGKE